MPNPLVGSGAPVSKDLRRYAYALYLAPASSGASYPAAPLGATEPTGGWVRQGRLKDDFVTFNIPKPQFLEGRAGFTRSLKFYPVKVAEMIEITMTMDETDPLILTFLRGQGGYNSLSSGSYLGEEFIYKTGKFYASKILFVGIDQMQTAGANGLSRERHIYCGNSVVTFNIKETEDESALEVSAVLLDVSSTETFRDREWEAF